MTIDILNYLAGCPYPELKSVFVLLHKVINLIKIFVPILLVIFGTLDLAKAVIAGKEDEMKKNQSALIRRFLYAAAIFLIITLVQFVISFIASADVEDVDKTTWLTCLKQ